LLNRAYKAALKGIPLQQIFVGRQAIFDRALRVYAYELLYREGREASATIRDGDQASSRVMLNAFMEIGLQRIAGNKKVFINLTRSFFIDHPSIPFEKDRVVLEILEDVEIDQQLIDAVAELKAQGYRLALDDFEFEARWDPLLPHVDIIKVEVPTLDWDGLPQQLERLNRYSVRLLAEKVETESEYQRLLGMGFDYYQGFYFSRPHVVEGQRLSENRSITLQLLARLNDPEVSITELDQLISHDPGLSFKILRYLNSAAVSLPRKIDSIHQAVIYLGMQRLRAWASLVTLSGIKEKPEELFITALVRAHLCMRLVATDTRSDPNTAFTAGLLSILDQLMGRPLAGILQEISLAPHLQLALLQHEGLIGQALRCATAIEYQRWEDIRFPGLEPNQVHDIYLSSSELAFQETAALID